VKASWPVGVVVEQVVKHRQQRHGFLLDVRHLALDQFGGQALQVRRAARVARVPAGQLRAPAAAVRPRRRAACRARRPAWLGQVAVARLGQAGEQLGLFEAEVVADLVLKLAQQRCEASACSAAFVAGGQRVAHTVEQRDAAAVLVVEQPGDLAHEAHGMMVRWNACNKVL
jgi:hypothetical protein